jgi:hypothetical protein
MDTFVYIDPAMRTTKRTVSGELKDDRWHIRYSIPAGGRGLSAIWVDDLWTKERPYMLIGTASPH